MTEYIKATIYFISSPINQYTRKPTYVNMKTQRDLIKVPREHVAYGIILKKTIFGVKEILSNESIYVIDYNNEKLFKKQLDYINNRLNQGETILFVTKQAITEYKELATYKQIEEYIERADTNYFYNYISKPLPKKKEESNQDIKQIKKLIKNHKKVCE